MKRYYKVDSSAEQNERIREMVDGYSEKHGTQLKWFANQIGISATYFHTWFSGKRDIANEYLNRIQAAIA